MTRKQMTLNTTFALVAAVAAASTPPAHAEPAAILASSSTAAGTAAASGAVAATVVGLSAASRQALPGYPIAAYRDGHRAGQVTLAYTVQPDGRVSHVRVQQAEPMLAFTRTAVRMVSGWRFVPSTAVQERLVEVRFTAD